MHATPAMDARRLPELGISIYERVGRGNQGKVFRGVHDESGETVAVKLLNNSEQRVDAAATEVEVAALRRLKGHDSILSLKSPPTATKRPCKRRPGELHPCIALVTEYAPHGTLREQVVLGGLSESAARTYFTQLISALQHASSHGVAHRDVKPANILLATDWSLRLADFGLASLAAAGSSAMQTQCGTRRYMAPEVLLGLPYTGEAVDVWSAGVVLFMLLTGGPPWDDASDRDWYFVASPSPRFWEAHERFYSFSPSAKALITAMLAKKASERCSLAACAAHAWLSGGPAMGAAELAVYMSARNGIPAPAAPVAAATAAASAAPAAACGGSGGPSTAAASGAAASAPAADAEAGSGAGSLRASSAMSSSGSDAEADADVRSASSAAAASSAAGRKAEKPAAASAPSAAVGGDAVARTWSLSGKALGSADAAAAGGGAAGDAFARRATRSSVPATATAVSTGAAVSGAAATLSPSATLAPGSPTAHRDSAELRPPPPAWRPGSALLAQLPAHLPRGHVAVSALSGTCSIAFEDALRRAVGAGALALPKTDAAQLVRPTCVVVRAGDARTAVAAVASFIEHVLTGSILKVAAVAGPAAASSVSEAASGTWSGSAAHSPSLVLTARIEVPTQPPSQGMAAAGAAAGSGAGSASLVVTVDFVFADAAPAGSAASGKADVAVLCQRRSGDDGAFVQVVAALRSVLGTSLRT